MKKGRLIFLLVLSMLFLLLGCASQTRPINSPVIGLVPEFNRTERICVLPVLFIPSDSSLSDSDISSAKQLLQAHLKLAQALYQKLLNTSFCVKDEVLIYRSPNNNAYFIVPPNTDYGTGSRLLNELFAQNNDDRYNSSLIYLTLYVRPKDAAGQRLLGGGRTFNGPPNSGGGYVELEYTSLVKDKPYPFQSTLVHELGHAFGLTHSTCFGYGLNTGDSIMVYNPKHGSKGLIQSSEPGIFTPEEYFELSLNKRAFPDFNYSDELYNPQHKAIDANAIQSCFLGQMDEYIGKYQYLPGVGYELFFNGKLVSGPGAALYSLKQAQDNCKRNQENHKGISIKCRYNGQTFYGTD